MKKVFIILCTVITLVGCQSKNESIELTNEQAISAINQIDPNVVVSLSQKVTLDIDGNTITKTYGEWLDAANKAKYEMEVSK